MSDVLYILPVGYGEVQGEEGVVPMVCPVMSVINTDTQTEHTRLTNRTVRQKAQNRLPWVPGGLVC